MFINIHSNSQTAVKMKWREFAGQHNCVLFQIPFSACRFYLILNKQCQYCMGENVKYWNLALRWWGTNKACNISLNSIEFTGNGLRGGILSCDIFSLQKQETMTQSKRLQEFLCIICAQKSQLWYLDTTLESIEHSGFLKKSVLIKSRFVDVDEVIQQCLL